MTSARSPGQSWTRFRESLLVLDEDLRVVIANRSFYRTFKLNRQDVQGRPIYALGDGQWNIPELRLLLNTIASQNTMIESFEVERDFDGIGRRSMLLNARKLFDEDYVEATILLAIEDITERRAIERAVQELLRHKDVLLQEMEHRVANSLQMIASILLLKARAVTSEETRLHLKDAHQRVMSIAAVQQHLHASEGILQIEVSSYLSKLCSSLGSSMIGEGQAIAIKVAADEGMIESARAVCIGLIVTELLINAIKYAFPASRAGALVLVTYKIDGADWKLAVADNGVGRRGSDASGVSNGLGTAIVNALAHQLDARMEVVTSAAGMSVWITHATFTSRAVHAV